MLVPPWCCEIRNPNLQRKWWLLRYEWSNAIYLMTRKWRIWYHGLIALWKMAQVLRKGNFSLIVFSYVNIIHRFKVYNVEWYSCAQIPHLWVSSSSLIIFEFFISHRPSILSGCATLFTLLGCTAAPPQGRDCRACTHDERMHAASNNQVICQVAGLARSCNWIEGMINRLWSLQWW